MANYTALAAVGDGLALHLRRAYELGGASLPSCTFAVQGAKEMRALQDSSATCALYLYRVTHNEHVRNTPPVAPSRPLPVDLHYLFSVWMDSALGEHTVLGWVLRELARYPVLDTALLGRSAGFTPVERLQLVPAELSLDDTSKLWQMLNAPYRPSLTYIVRNVRIGPEAAEDAPPVVASRLEFRDDVAALAMGGAA